MRNRRQLAKFGDYRSALHTRGDVEIGIMAIRRRRRNIVIAVMGILFIAGACWLYLSLQPAENDIVTGDEYHVKVQCINEECGYVGVVRVKAGQKFPLKCPKCGQRSARQLWQCRNPECGQEFLPTEVGKTIRCPKCGSTSVGTAVAKQP
ncbi:MAG: hypothetical protein ABIG44_08835 [Planctomycetota bacterium]